MVGRDGAMVWRSYNSKSTPSSQQKIRGVVAGDNKLEEDVTKKRREILE